MAKRKYGEAKAMRPLLVPGVCFEHVANGTIGKILSRKVTEDGVMVRVSYASIKHVHESSCDLSTLSGNVRRIAETSEYDAAVARLRDAKEKTKSARKVARVDVSDERIDKLEARVKYLEEVVAYIERATNVRPFRRFAAAE